MWYAKIVDKLGAGGYRHGMIPALLRLPVRFVVNVYTFVKWVVSGGTYGGQIAALQRDVWRIDKKVDRHIAGGAPSGNGAPAAAPASSFDLDAYPYLRQFPNPWVAAGAPGAPGDDDGPAKT